MTKRNFKGIWIPREIWLSTELNLQEKVFLIEIDSLQDDVKGCFAGNKYFAEFFQMSESRASQVISGLQKKGLVSIKNIRKGPLTVERQIWISDAFNILKAAVSSPSGSSDSAFRILQSAPLESCEHINTTDIINTDKDKKKEDARENALDDIFGMTDFPSSPEPESEEAPAEEEAQPAKVEDAQGDRNLPAVIVGEVLPAIVVVDFPAPLSEFDVFWEAYPRKLSPGKVSGEKGALAKAMKIASFDDILAGLERSKALWDLRKAIIKLDPKYFASDIPHPSTWLNQGRWADDTETEIENAQRDYDRIAGYANASDRYVPMVEGARLALAGYEKRHQGR